MVVQTQITPEPTPITVNENKMKNITDKTTVGGGPHIKIRLLIQSRVGGAIIGKGGRNIMSLRQDHQAKISVPDSPGPERVITIAANEDSVMEIIKKILSHIDEGRGRGGGGDHEVRVLVHQSRSGAVIGKGGGTIKELRAETGARIKLFTESCPCSTDRVMLVNGSDETIVETLKKVNHILKDVEIRGPYEPYDPYNYDPPSAYSYGGFPEGEGRTAGYTRGQVGGYAAKSGWYGPADQYAAVSGVYIGRGGMYGGRGYGYGG